MKIYTDGATSNNGYNGATGGWAFIVVENNKVIFKASGFVPNATNNICELLAIINACKYADKYNCPVVIYSDSAYCINCYLQKWYKKWIISDWKNSKKQPVANKELWRELIPFFEKDNFTFEKVKGHDTNMFNNIVDQLAVEAKSDIHS